ncbi:gastrula zinc finger protein xFG20-1-like [Anopheles nili]|uniref:gastrula zinc finger protein xFG20-1-like n=1 Tax=Anopheles nili TaxID=185578 RepID=UPI00237ABA6A|nr:gastrula zinc finger protein xFG20-1-like [Anopheles nili]
MCPKDKMQLDARRCKCCGECTNDLRTINQCVTVAGKNIAIWKMMEIFQLPEDFSVAQDEDICAKCLEKLICCYHFYDIFVAAMVQMKETTDNSIPVQVTVCHCSFCEMSFTTKQEYEKHLKLQHPSSSTYLFCVPCQRSFKTTRGLLQHNAMYHESKETYTCHICNRLFITQTNYQNHMRYHQDYVCSFCNGGWNGEPKLLDHVRTVHADRQFVCRFCDKTERLKKCLNRHLRSVHRQMANPYFCGHCGKDSSSFESYELLKDHLQGQHAEDENSTPEKDSYETLLNDSLFAKELVPLEFHEADGIDKEQDLFLQNFHLIRSIHEKHGTSTPHTEQRIDRRMVLEDFLDEAFENDEIWKKYIEIGEEYLIDDYDFCLKGIVGNSQQEPYKYRCPNCQQGFQKQLHLTVHLAESHNVASLVCNDCGASFTHVQNYRTHRKEHMKENVRFRENNIPEVEEALSLVQSTPLGYTIREEENGYRFTCCYCDRSFQRKHNLEKHKCRSNKRHGPTGAGIDGETSQIQCAHCQFRTFSAEELDKHQRSHQSEVSPVDEQETIYCLLCDRRFSTTNGLKYHLKRHTGIKAFTCLYCGKKFTANSNLNAHIRNVHSERKDYQCAECTQSFTTKDHLNKHQRSQHRQERPFACGECEKSYIQRSHLNEHVAACHRQDRYLCNTCNVSYGCRSSLKRHHQQKHGASSMA